MQAEIDAARASTPLPPGASYPPVTFDDDAFYEPGSGKFMIQYQAMCAWNRYWIQGVANNDAQQVRMAQEASEDIKTWDFYRAGDPSTRDHIDEIYAAALLGDLSGLQLEVRVNC